MPLRDIGEYRRWIERESPSPAAQRVARSFLAEIGGEPWRVPSVPVDVLSNQPEYEVREAVLLVEDKEALVQVWYRHFYASGAVDVIAVTDVAPPEA